MCPALSHVGRWQQTCTGMYCCSCFIGVPLECLSYVLLFGIDVDKRRQAVAVDWVVSRNHFHCGHHCGQVVTTTPKASAYATSRHLALAGRPRHISIPVGFSQSSARLIARPLLQVRGRSARRKSATRRGRIGVLLNYGNPKTHCQT